MKVSAQAGGLYISHDDTLGRDNGCVVLDVESSPKCTYTTFRLKSIILFCEKTYFCYLERNNLMNM